MISRRFLTSVLALAGIGAPGWATTTYYCDDCGVSNNQTAFNNATSTLFFGSGFANLMAANGAYASGITDGNGILGLNFFGYNTSGTQAGVTVFNNAVEQTATGQNTSLQVQLPTNLVYAFAMHVSVVSSTGSPCVEAVSGVGSFNNANCNSQPSITSNADTEFVGVVSDSPLPSVFLGFPMPASGPQLKILDFELGEQAQTPETATMVLIGTGLVFMRFLRRRKQTPSGTAPERASVRGATAPAPPHPQTA